MEGESQSSTEFKQCELELEERVSAMKTREEQLRKDYDKCIAWRIRVWFHEMIDE